MTHEEFSQLLDAIHLRSKDVLTAKAKEYASADDRLHNFKRAGALQGCSPEQALIGMLTKHLVSVLDMVDELSTPSTPRSMQMWREKLDDSRNYLSLLEGLVSERYERRTPTTYAPTLNEK